MSSSVIDVEADGYQQTANYDLLLLVQPTNDIMRATLYSSSMTYTLV